MRKVLNWELAHGSVAASSGPSKKLNAKDNQPIKAQDASLALSRLSRDVHVWVKNKVQAYSRDWMDPYQGDPQSYSVGSKELKNLWGNYSIPLENMEGSHVWFSQHMHGLQLIFILYPTWMLQRIFAERVVCTIKPCFSLHCFWQKGHFIYYTERKKIHTFAKRGSQATWLREGKTSHALTIYIREKYKTHQELQSLTQISNSSSERRRKSRYYSLL